MTVVLSVPGRSSPRSPLAARGGGKGATRLLHDPFMRDVEHWAVLTIGTCLGNASFLNKQS